MSVDPRNWMWNEACAMIERAEHLHRQFFEPLADNRTASWQPPIDVFETEDAITIMVALPGVEEDSFEVRSGDGMLLIRGVRRLPLNAHAARIHRLEIPNGRFERRIRMEGAELSGCRSELRNGCLVVTCDKRTARHGG